MKRESTRSTLILPAGPELVATAVAIEHACGLSSRGEAAYLSAISDPRFIFLIALRKAPASLSAPPLTPPRIPIGLFSGITVIDELQIDNLAVIPDARESGVASALLTEAFSRARLLGATSALLEVRSANLPARNLYQKFGFRVIGRRPAYYHAPADDALVMSCDLNPPPR